MRTFNTTIEISKADGDGCLSDIEVDIVVEYSTSPGCRGTHWEPEEPASIDLGKVTLKSDGREWDLTQAQEESIIRGIGEYEYEQEMSGGYDG